VLTTDKGNEFSSFQGEIGDAAVRRVKEPEDKNALAVIDRGMRTLKNSLAAEVAKKGGSWTTHFEKTLDNYNKTPHQTTIGAPEDVEKTATLDFRQAQDNAGKFLHSNSMTQRRLTAHRDRQFRAPTNAARSFKPQYGNAQRLRSADSQFLTGVNGKKHLSKQVQLVPEGSENAKAQLTSDRPLKIRLRSIADMVADFISQEGGSMSLQNLEAVLRRGLGLPGVFKTIRRNRPILRNLLKLFADLSRSGGA
jgi:hypothetical protein